MTYPVPTVDVLPAAPDPDDDEAAFDTDAFAWSSALPSFRTQLLALGDNVLVNAGYAHEQAGVAEGWADTASGYASNAAASAATAATSTAIALGSANFKGLWPSLAGALAKPACVKHNGHFWLLLNNLGNVAASEPGVTADWTAMDQGVTPTQTITADTVGVAGVRYLIDATGITLTLPVPVYKGDYTGWREVHGSVGAVVRFGTTKCRGRSPGDLYIDMPGMGVDLYFEDATRGYC